MNKNHILTYGVVAGATTLGFLVGYRVGKNRMITEYTEVIDTELEAIKDSYQRKYKEGAYASAESASAVLNPATEEGKEEIHPDIPEELHHIARRAIKLGEDQVTFVTRAMLSVQDEVEEYSERVSEYGQPMEEDQKTSMVQRATRDPNRPHVITKEEFYENDLELAQVGLTWWVGDRQLADERDQMIVDVQGMVGYANLETFGSDPESMNTIYIRSAKHHADFEITRDPRKYGVIVAGEEALNSLPQTTRGPRRGRDD